MGESWKAGVGLARAGAASSEPAINTYLPCESANIERKPKTFTRRPGYVPDPDRLVAAGYDYSFKVSGITLRPFHMAYLFWMALGGDTYNASPGDHTIIGADDGQYLNLFRDLGVDVETGAGTGTVERLIGAKIQDLSFDQQMNEYAKMDISGPGCNIGTPVASMVPSLVTGADHEPVGWHHLKVAGGTPAFFKVGLNGAAAAAVTNVQYFKLKLSRPPIPSGMTLGSNQPTAIGGGQRELTFEFGAELTGADAVAQFAAFAAQQELSLDIKWVIGTTPNYIRMEIPAAAFAASPVGDIGAKDEVIKYVASGLAYRSGSNPLIRLTAKDGTSALYT